ncbi:glycosyltransferase family 2 protein [Candidatus Uhrbacteria bacterium]|nr:glycosyltransferase family 2 protein [Candidatus Uhrbacteria bacterium]
MSTISVIIPTYQHEQTLSRCLDSLLAQSRTADEIIVIDDGSTDATQELLARYRSRVQSYYQTNQGAPAARNAGAAHSHGDLLLFCDADIQADSHLLKEMEQALQSHPQAAYAYGVFFWGKKRFAYTPFDANILRQHNFIHTTSLIRRTAFVGFDPTLKRFQDWDLWLTLLENGQMGIGINKELFRVLPDHGRASISTWMPSIMYRLPWNRIGWMPKTLRDYKMAMNVIKQKHHLV